MHFDATDFAAMDETQRLAVLETMVLGLIADQKVTPPEIRRFDEIVFALPWGVDRETLTAMIKGARDRVVKVNTPAEVQDYLASVAQRIPTQAMREKAVFTMATLCLSDGEMSQKEIQTIGVFVIAFGITSDRAAAIREALHIKPAAPAAPAAEPSTN